MSSKLKAPNKGATQRLKELFSKRREEAIKKMLKTNLKNSYRPQKRKKLHVFIPDPLLLEI